MNIYAIRIIEGGDWFFANLLPQRVFEEDDGSGCEVWAGHPSKVFIGYLGEEINHILLPT